MPACTRTCGSEKSNQPKLFPNFKWAPYPGVTPGQPSHVTIGGINLAVSTYSKHPTEAFAATLCLRDRQNQLVNATKGGTPPSLASLYGDPALAADYPFAKEIQDSLSTAAIRPLTPAYQNISIVVSHAVSPPDSIRPAATAKSIRSQLTDALQSKGLVP